jgi:hypothetical protein
VANWNAHRIRVQPTKEHIIDGRSPYQLWENPPDGFRSFGLTPNVNLIDALEEYVIGWGKLYSQRLLSSLYKLRKL